MKRGLSTGHIRDEGYCPRCKSGKSSSQDTVWRSRAFHTPRGHSPPSPSNWQRMKYKTSFDARRAFLVPVHSRSPNYVKTASARLLTLDRHLEFRGASAVVNRVAAMRRP